jgi:hypothetical protein
MPRRVLAIVTDPLEGPEPIEEINRTANGSGVELRLVVPAVEESAFRHTMGDIDGPVRHAEETLEASLKALRAQGFEASGSVGDSDPVLAAQDALRAGPADEIVIFENPEDEARWYEDGLFERAKEALEPPLRMVLVERSQHRDPHVVGVEKAGAGTVPTEDPDSEVEISENLPRFAHGELSGIVLGLAGALVAGVLAAVIASGSGPEAGWKAVAIAVALGISLVNLAHVIGLTLMESVHYRGRFAKLFRAASLALTPAAVLVNLAILLFLA